METLEFLATTEVQYFEDIELTQTQKYTPEILYQVFGIVICIDHFRDKLFVRTTTSQSTTKKQQNFHFRNGHPHYSKPIFCKLSFFFFGKRNVQLQRQRIFTNYR